MRRLTLASLAVACLAPGLAFAQQPAPPGPPGQPGQDNRPADPTEGANEVVGLFVQTCLKYASNPNALRTWLAQQQAPEMPAQMRDFFLQGRRGMVYDVSYRSVRLALVSADDGSCSAYAETADPALTLNDLRQALQEGNVGASEQPSAPDPQHPNLQHVDFRITLNGHPYTVYTVTASAPAQEQVQVALTLRPGS